MKNISFYIIVTFMTYACQNSYDSYIINSNKILVSDNLSGKELYQKKCMACHQSDALGIEGVFPPIKNSDYFLEDPKRVIHNILYGQSGDVLVNGVLYNGIMPSIKLNDEDLLKLVNYLLQEVNCTDDSISEKDIEWVKANN